MKRRNKIKLVSLALGLVFVASGTVQAALTITGQAYTTTSVGLENGTGISTNGYVALGYYGTNGTVPTRTVLESYTTASSFLTGFTIVAQGAMGMDLGAGSENYPSGYPALFSAGIAVNDGDNTLLNKRFAIIIGNGTSISDSTQLGVVSKSSWVITSNPTSPTPEPYAFDVADVASDTSAIFFGSFSSGTGSYPLDTVNDQFRLQTVVPEPSTGALLMIGSVGLVALRRLRKV